MNILQPGGHKPRRRNTRKPKWVEPAPIVVSEYEPSTCSVQESLESGLNALYRGTLKLPEYGLDIPLPKRRVDIKPKKLLDLYETQKGKCALSGLQLTPYLYGEPGTVLAIGIDAINPKYGYVPSNVRLVCWPLAMGRLLTAKLPVYFGSLSYTVYARVRQYGPDTTYVDCDNPNPVLAGSHSMIAHTLRHTPKSRSYPLAICSRYDFADRPERTCWHSCCYYYYWPGMNCGTAARTLGLISLLSFAVTSTRDAITVAPEYQGDSSGRSRDKTIPLSDPKFDQQLVELIAAEFNLRCGETLLEI